MGCAKTGGLVGLACRWKSCRGWPVIAWRTLSSSITSNRERKTSGVPWREVACAPGWPRAAWNRRVQPSELRAKLVAMKDSTWRPIRDELLGRLPREKNVTTVAALPKPSYAP